MRPGSSPSALVAFAGKIRPQPGCIPVRSARHVARKQSGCSVHVTLRIPLDMMYFFLFFLSFFFLFFFFAPLRNNISRPFLMKEGKIRRGVVSGESHVLSPSFEKDAPSKREFFRNLNVWNGNFVSAKSKRVEINSRRGEQDASSVIWKNVLIRGGEAFVKALAGTRRLNGKFCRRN